MTDAIRDELATQIVELKQSLEYALKANEIMETHIRNQNTLLDEYEMLCGGHKETVQ
jgi:hypothetical protein